MNWFLDLVELLVGLICILLAVDIWNTFWKPRKVWKEMEARKRHHWGQHQFWRAEADEWRHRAEFAELYAAQLEAEYDVPKIDRINNRSWRHKFPNYVRLTIPEDK